MAFKAIAQHPTPKMVLGLEFAQNTPFLGFFVLGEEVYPGKRKNRRRSEI
jgi:hypothetical protein